MRPSAISAFSSSYHLCTKSILFPGLLRPFSGAAPGQVRVWCGKASEKLRNLSGNPAETFGNFRGFPENPWFWPGFDPALTRTCPGDVSGKGDPGLPDQAQEVFKTPKVFGLIPSALSASICGPVFLGRLKTGRGKSLHECT